MIKNKIALVLIMVGILGLVGCRSTSGGPGEVVGNTVMNKGEFSGGRTEVIGDADEPVGSDIDTYEIGEWINVDRYNTYTNEVLQCDLKISSVKRGNEATEIVDRYNIDRIYTDIQELNNESTEGYCVIEYMVRFPNTYTMGEDGVVLPEAYFDLILEDGRIIQARVINDFGGEITSIHQGEEFTGYAVVVIENDVDSFLISYENIDPNFKV